MSVHRALMLSGILFVAPYLPPTLSLWKQQERARRTGYLVALGFPTYAHNEATRSEGQDQSVRLHVKHGTLLHLLRLSTSTSTYELFCSISNRTASTYRCHSSSLHEALGYLPAHDATLLHLPWENLPFSVFYQDP